MLKKTVTVTRWFLHEWNCSSTVSIMTGEIQLKLNLLDLQKVLGFIWPANSTNNCINVMNNQKRYNSFINLLWWIYLYKTLPYKYRFSIQHITEQLLITIWKQLKYHSNRHFFKISKVSQMHEILCKVFFTYKTFDKILLSRWDF